MALLLERLLQVNTNLTSLVNLTLVGYILHDEAGARDSYCYIVAEVDACSTFVFAIPRALPQVAPVRSGGAIARGTGMSFKAEDDANGRVWIPLSKAVVRSFLSGSCSSHSTSTLQSYGSLAKWQSVSTLQQGFAHELELGKIVKALECGTNPSGDKKHKSWMPLPRHWERKEEGERGGGGGGTLFLLHLDLTHEILQGTVQQQRPSDASLGTVIFWSF